MKEEVELENELEEEELEEEELNDLEKEFKTDFNELEDELKKLKQEFSGIKPHRPIKNTNEHKPKSLFLQRNKMEK